VGYPVTIFNSGLAALFGGSLLYGASHHLDRPIVVFSATLTSVILAANIALPYFAESRINKKIKTGENEKETERLFPIMSRRTFDKNIEYDSNYNY